MGSDQYDWINRRFRCGLVEVFQPEHLQIVRILPTGKIHMEMDVNGMKAMTVKIVQLMVTILTEVWALQMRAAAGVVVELRPHQQVPHLYRLPHWIVVVFQTMKHVIKLLVAVTI